MNLYHAVVRLLHGGHREAKFEAHNIYEAALRIREYYGLKTREKHNGFYIEEVWI